MWAPLQSTAARSSAGRRSASSAARSPSRRPRPRHRRYGGRLQRRAVRGHRTHAPEQAPPYSRSPARPRRRGLAARRAAAPRPTRSGAAPRRPRRGHGADTADGFATGFVAARRGDRGQRDLDHAARAPTASPRPTVGHRVTRRCTRAGPRRPSPTSRSATAPAFGVIKDGDSYVLKGINVHVPGERPSPPPNRRPGPRRPGRTRGSPPLTEHRPRRTSSPVTIRATSSAPPHHSHRARGPPRPAVAMAGADGRSRRAPARTPPNGPRGRRSAAGRRRRTRRSGTARGRPPAAGRSVGSAGSAATSCARNAAAAAEQEREHPEADRRRRRGRGAACAAPA